MPFHSSRFTAGVSASLALVLALAACGSDKADNEAAAVETLTGTAAIGAAVAQGIVDIQCASGNRLRTTTAGDGTWRVSLDGLQTFPCAVRVSGGTPAITLHGYATEPGQANVTPLTDLVVAHAARQAPADWFAAGTPLAADALAASRGALLDTLREAGIVPPEGDPLTTPFVIGDAWDQTLDRLGDAIAANPALGGLQGLVAQAAQGQFASMTPPRPPIGQPAPSMAVLTDLKALAGTYYARHLGSSATCFGWGWPTPGPGKPNLKTFYEVRIDGDSGLVTLRPTNRAALIDPDAEAPASVRFDPTASGTLMQMQNAPGGFRYLFLQTPVDGKNRYISFVLDTDGRMANFRPSPSSLPRAIDFSDGTACYPSASLVEVPALSPADAEIPEALRGSFTFGFGNAPFGGYTDGGPVPGSPHNEDDSVNVVIGADTLTIDGRPLTGALRPPGDEAAIPGAFVFQDGERWYWLYNNPAQPGINVYGGASPGSEATTFFGTLRP